MRGIKQSLATTAAIAIAATGLAVTGTPTPAHAAGCRAAPYSATFIQAGGARWSGSTGWMYSTFGPYTTTSQCRDINLKNQPRGDRAARQLRACVIFVNHTSDCNYLTTVNAGQWANVATNVQDGTRFKVMIGVNTAATPYGADGVMDF
ncbi:hypothetical protein [Plantactinospora endophytica]|uniref:Secreted protein n=1 Tax=Plantactinospora endophytica TaxID=673535 RepID=A0ABQ4DWY7_9ACTN|nr:hypothetical protein [Plantactinospora endophytica]GIG86961.1 hypothetical protein Pen02_18970 [Plantactinospora endophytica]